MDWHKKRLESAPMKVKVRKDILVVPFEYKAIRHYKCNFCNFRTTTLSNRSTSNLISHLKVVHFISFRKGQSQEVQLANTILSLSHFTESTDVVKTWTCKYCNMLFIFPTHEIKHIQNGLERQQIETHMISCKEKKKIYKPKHPPIDN